jgi:hypothetical protein
MKNSNVISQKEHLECVITPLIAINRFISRGPNTGHTGNEGVLSINSCDVFLMFFLVVLPCLLFHLRKGQDTEYPSERKRNETWQNKFSVLCAYYKGRFRTKSKRTRFKADVWINRPNRQLKNKKKNATEYLKKSSFSWWIRVQFTQMTLLTTCSLSVTY